jgi:hypothetical protein
MLRSGPNIAVKVPPRHWDRTVRFYAETLGLPRIETAGPAVMFALGRDRLRIDRVEALNEPEVWLEFQTDSRATTTALLSDEGFVHGDSIEALPAGFKRFWIASRADFMHLLPQDTAP